MRCGYSSSAPSPALADMNAINSASAITTAAPQPQRSVLHPHESASLLRSGSTRCNPPPAQKPASVAPTPSARKNRNDRHDIPAYGQTSNAPRTTLPSNAGLRIPRLSLRSRNPAKLASRLNRKATAITFSGSLIFTPLPCCLTF